MWRALGAWAIGLRSPLLLMLVAMVGVALLLVAQIPLRTTIDVGLEEGRGSDLPHLHNFNTAESDEHGTYRWTRDRARIFMPGVGQRPLLLRLDLFPVSAETLAHGPQSITVFVADEPLAELPIRMSGAQYHLVIPPHLVPSGQLDVLLRTATFTPPDDPRTLGSPLDRVTLTSLASPHLVIPDMMAIVQWVVALLLFLTTCRYLLDVPVRHPWILGTFGLGAMLILLAALLDPPRFAYGAYAAMMTALVCAPLAIILRITIPKLLVWSDIPISSRTLGWLLLIIIVSFGMRYGGRLYPRSMHGDIGFHTNRFNEAMHGDIYLLSRNRGVNFPYPPGPYLIIAPLALINPDPPAVLELTATLTEGISPLLIYILLMRSFVVMGQKGKRTEQVALLAAAIYAFTAAGFLTNWWFFSTHIYAQFLTLLFLTTLHHIVTSSTKVYHALLLLVLLTLVFLAHFGFLINTVLLMGMWLVWAWARPPTPTHHRLPPTITYVGAGLFVLIFFYSAYIPLFMAQIQAVSEGGLTGLAQRAPVPRWYLWQVLWEAGIIIHFGFFPLLLAPLSIGSKIPPWRTTALQRLLTLSFAVSAIFATLPFLTLSTQSTRWLMFSAWAVAIGAALMSCLLWRRGRNGRLVTLAMGAFVLWNTMTFWLGPLAWRIRPPEPF